MTEQKQAMQADGGGAAKGKADGVGQPVNNGRDPSGESGGGAYPNPHAGKTPEGGPDTFFGTGGQTDQAYHGGGQIAGEKADKDKPGRVGQGG